MAQLSLPKMENFIYLAKIQLNVMQLMVSAEEVLFSLVYFTNAICCFCIGRMSGLKEVHIVNIAPGKAHGLALTDKGIVYSFGINNKGQCGRDGLVSSSLIKQSSGESFTAATAPSDTIDDDIESEDGGSAAEVKLCPSGSHRWRVDQCMICTQCNQCTGLFTNFLLN